MAEKVSKLIEDLCFGDNSEGRGNSSENNDVSDIAEYELVKKQAKMDNDSIVIVDSPVQGEKEATINVWVQCDVCTLNFEDKKIIETGMELTDRHIQYAQQLAKIQFSTIDGLCSTLLQNKSHNYLLHNSVQVIFCNSRSHWIMISNMNCNKEVVNVYDSLFKVLDDETMDVIKNYFGTESKKRQKVKCNMVDVQTQEGSKDRELFAIAFLTSLVYNEDPS